MNKITEKQLLIDKIVEAMQDTKGEDILIFDLSQIENSVAQTFIICSGNSNTQVSAIAGGQVLPACLRQSPTPCRDHYLAVRAVRPWSRTCL